jgi:uncharacterized protein YqeY
MLLNQLREDMKTAMKAKDAGRLAVIRFLLAEIRNKEIDQGELDDLAIQNIIRKQIKQMQESNEQYVVAGREELVSENNQKIKILEEYLPVSMTADELAKVVSAVINENPGQSLGAVIKLVREKTQGQAEGGSIAAEVKKQLQ